MNQEKPQNLKYTRPYYGVGGWLYIVAIGLVLTVFTTIIDFSGALELYEPDTWYIYTNPNGDLYHPLFATWVNIQIIFSVILSLFSVYLLVLMFSKNKKFPKLMIVFLVAQITLCLIIFSLADSIFNTYSYSISEFNDLKYEYFTVLVRSIFQGAIWIPYFLISKRVKATYYNENIPYNKYISY